MSFEVTPWGGHSARLQLPGSPVVVEQLSVGQHRAIAEDYGAYIPSRGETSCEEHVVCRAGRLQQPIGFPHEHFLVNGQYSITKRRLGTSIEITGFDFAARFDRRAASVLSSATLLVAREEELPRASVLGNFLRVLLAHRALDRGGVMLHSAGVVQGGRAYLFSGRSNAGKTTLTSKAAAAGLRVLSDDINVVIPVLSQYRAHKVPFTGEFGRQVPTGVEPGSFPLGGLALLEKAPMLTAAPVSPAEAVAGLLTGCPFVNDDPEEFPALMEVLTRLVASTPVIRIGVALEDPFEAVLESMERHCGHG